jgi:putative Ca2+/H+ antiporter (TMEM165/GDT1 family)
VDETFGREWSRLEAPFSHRRVPGPGGSEEPVVAGVAVAAAVFGVTFLAELPDKSLFASLLLGTRYRPAAVWAGAAAAYAVHAAVAVAAGQVLVKVVPPRVLDGIVAGLFVAAAAYLAISSVRGTRREASGRTATAPAPPAPGRGAGRTAWWRVAGIGFAVVFAAEWGDVTQVTTANLAARYHDPAAVYIGAVLALWAVAALAVTVGARSLALLPVPWIRRISTAILLALGLYTAVTAITG